MRSEIKRFGTIVSEILSETCEDPTYTSPTYTSPTYARFTVLLQGLDISMPSRPDGVKMHRSHQCVSSKCSRCENCQWNCLRPSSVLRLRHKSSGRLGRGARSKRDVPQITATCAAGKKNAERLPLPLAKDFSFFSSDLGEEKQTASGKFQRFYRISIMLLHELFTEQASVCKLF